MILLGLLFVACALYCDLSCLSFSKNPICVIWARTRVTPISLFPYCNCLGINLAKFVHLITLCVSCIAFDFSGTQLKKLIRLAACLCCDILAYLLHTYCWLFWAKLWFWSLWLHLLWLLKVPSLCHPHLPFPILILAQSARLARFGCLFPFVRV